MKYVAILSGECAGLSLAELGAYVDARGSRFKVHDRADRVVVFEAGDGIDFSGLALVHEVCLFFGYRSDDVDTAKLDGKVKVRGRKIGMNISLSVSAIEKKVGKILCDNSIRIDFSSTCVVRIYVAKDKSYFGKVVCTIDKKALQARDAKFRPYFAAGTINAIYARSFVNLLHCSKGAVVADPFCGSGAFLIEAGLMGMDVFGFDISKKHIEGALKNLSHYGVERCEVVMMDALDSGCLKKKFDGVVCDLPWGKSTVMKYDKEELVRGFMKVLPKILKKKKFAVIACDVPELWHPPELKLISRFELYVHRSAKRYVWVFQR